ncbi:MAG: NAD(P)/FAD-dependent oxidoreductase [Anaerolineae bacterium]|nr:NAD(P)/FAD-dependent oxidoreductase [Anaerolineae bacterium]
MRHVIIGNSAAAIGCVEGIRHYDRENPITIVADEPHHTYSRPLISYLLGGLVDESRMAYRPADFYEKNRVETLLGVRVTEVTPQSRTLSLAGGGSLAYDHLLVATGGKPFVPPIPGASLQGVFTFITWDEARQIDHFIEDRGVTSALVIGAGLIGLKTIEALLARGIKVTVVELADRILSTIFDATASRLAEIILRRENVDIKTKTTVTDIIGRGGRVDHAVLAGGERVDCDLVVFAIGVRPNTGLIPADSGIQVERGIRVDDHMRTTAPDVYAAGDCVEAYDPLIDDYRQIAIWPLAYRQGYIAGANMAGADRAYEGGFPMNAISVCEVPTISVGLIDPPEDGDRYEIMDDYDRATLTYKKLVLRGHRLVGAMFINDIDRAGIYTGLIRDQADISQFKDHLLSGSFGLISLPKEYRKHLVVGSGIEV